MRLKVLVLKGLGINCEREMARAFALAGAEPVQVAVNALLDSSIDLSLFRVIAFPGGFSFGDELGAGKVFAHRLTARSDVGARLRAFVAGGGCILGVCNGFQVLVKLGLLPDDGRRVALAKNAHGRFLNRWVWHRVTAQHCVFTQGCERLYLPVRHSEGRLVGDVEGLYRDQRIALQYADDDGEVATQYPENPNGSPLAAAALCDTTGRVLGLMAHPEAAVDPLHDPRWPRVGERGALADGLRIFRNVVQYAKEKQVNAEGGERCLTV